MLYMINPSIKIKHELIIYKIKSSLIENLFKNEYLLID